jgi:hypothetical protein
MRKFCKHQCGPNSGHRGGARTAAFAGGKLVLGCWVEDRSVFALALLYCCCQSLTAVFQLASFTEDCLDCGCASKD